MTRRDSPVVDARGQPLEPGDRVLVRGVWMSIEIITITASIEYGTSAVLKLVDDGGREEKMTSIDSLGSKFAFMSVNDAGADEVLVGICS
jgi:hypothetical protein